MALIEGDELLERRQRLVPYNHGSTALAYLDGCFRGLELSPRDVDLFVCGLGPGSFTGLRVGLSTIKALARATARPLEGVSSLAAMAYPHALTLGPGALICATIDARRREVYAGCWRLTKGGGLDTLVAPAAFAPDALRDRLGLLEASPLLIVGPGPERHPSMVPPGARCVPALCDPVALAHLGRLQAVARGRGADLHSLEPEYCRPSDAEINLARRQAREGA